MFYEKSCSKRFRSIHRRTPVLESLLNKVAGVCFFVNIAKFLRNLIWRTSTNGCFWRFFLPISLHYGLLSEADPENKLFFLTFTVLALNKRRELQAVGSLYLLLVWIWENANWKSLVFDPLHVMLLFKWKFISLKVWDLL